MSKKNKKTKGGSPPPKSNEKTIADNRKARHKFEVLDTLECGIVLVGSEVKGLRTGKMSLEEAYARVVGDEVWLVGCDIQPYSHANVMNHDPRRRRKLLLHRREIRKFAAKAYETGLTLVPLKMYFKRGRVKVLLGICKGRKLYDKREKMKKEAVKRDLARTMRGK